MCSLVGLRGLVNAVNQGIGFRFANLTDVYDINFLPGAAKYHDLPGLLALSAPTKLWLSGEGKQAPPLIQAAYAASGKADYLTVIPTDSGDAASAAVKWLLRE